MSFVAALVLGKLHWTELAASTQLCLLSTQSPVNVLADEAFQMEPELGIHSPFPTPSHEPEPPFHFRPLNPTFPEPTRSPHRDASIPQFQPPVVAVPPWLSCSTSRRAHPQSSSNRP